MGRRVQVHSVRWKGPKNLTVDEMKDQFHEMASTGERPAYFVIIVITDINAEAPGHRTEYLTGKDGGIIEINEMKMAFKNVKIEDKKKTLQDVPKIFIFKGSQGHPFRSTRGKSNDINKRKRGHFIPEMSDMLLIYPPIANYDEDGESFERATNADRFISDLAEIFYEYGKTKHVVEIATRLNRKMTHVHSGDNTHSIGRTEKEPGCPGVTAFLSTLRKQLFLFEDAPAQNSHSNIRWTETLEKMTEVSKKFQYEQWQKFALEELKLDKRDLNPKLEALERWANKRKNPLEDLRKLQHHFFCRDKNQRDECDNEKWLLPDDNASSKESTPPNLTNQLELEQAGSIASKQKPNDRKTIPGSTGGDHSSSKAPIDIGNESDDGIYSQTGKKNVLIINNSFCYKTPDKQYGPRSPGCYYDSARMLELWRDELRCELFESRIHEDLTATEIKEILNRMEANIIGADCAYIVVIIMSHGDSDENGDYLVGMKGDDDKHDEVYMRDIKNAFATEKLLQIPKLFIIQGCRGTLADSGVEVQCAGTNKDRAFSEVPHLFSDFLVMYPSPPHHYAYAENYPESEKEKSGSWLIKEVYEIFMDKHKTMHVADMLTVVNDAMAAHRGVLQGNCHVQTMSEFVSFLAKDLYLSGKESH